MKTHLIVAMMTGAALLAIAGADAANAQQRGEVAAGDIVVTARRVEERLQDVPISITVFNQQQLTNRNVFSAKDIATFTPSLQANSRYGSENTTFAIRGFAQEVRTQPSVAVYFADVVAPRGGGTNPNGDGAGPGSFFDLQNVQVLKGPQGTLFGRNTTGGAVLLVPQKPTSRFEGYVEGSYGNYDMKRVQGVLNTPLGDRARFRVGFDHQVRDGYLKNISGIGPKDFADVNYWAARASLVVDLTPTLENYTIASYSRSDTNGQIPKVAGCFPVRSGRAVYGGELSCAQIAREQGKGYYAVENGIADPKLALSQWQVINTTAWKAADTLTIKNVVSYAQLTNLTRSEAFGTFWVIPSGTLAGRPTGIYAGLNASFARSSYAPATKSANQSTFTEELQFQGDALGNRLKWQAGAYLELSDPLGFNGGSTPANLPCTNQDALQCTDAIGAITATQGGVGLVTYFKGKTSYRNVGIYGQATYSITDKLKLTGGIRYTSDHTHSVANKILYRFPQPNQPVAACLDSSLTLPTCTLDVATTTRAPTWIVGLDYKPIDSLLVYAKYSRGYRQGSTNPYGAEGFSTFRPEKVDTYEGGVKATFADAIRGTFNVTGFYSKFSDQQLNVGMVSLLGRVQANSAIVNAGKSRMWGIEVESSVQPVRGLSLSVSYAYLNTKLESLDPIVPKGLYDFVSNIPPIGGDLPYAPHNKVSANANYTLPLPDSIGKISAGITYTYTSRLLASGAINFPIPGNEIVNANASWNKIAGLPVDLAFFMTNLTNQKYRVAAIDQMSSGFTSWILAEPRMYGARVRYSF